MKRRDRQLDYELLISLFGTLADDKSVALILKITAPGTCSSLSVIWNIDGTEKFFAIDSACLTTEGERALAASASERMSGCELRRGAMPCPSFSRTKALHLRSFSRSIAGALATFCGWGDA